ncbi:VirB4 family type IV secretion/conjugal transfer ATPase [Massilia sp. erpn]|uniref:VirB4 family type IV secretion/conjugal transfer ATPase n=1 Tax=Massilia sp. erpn TaxID=2738142 RepID=UPI00210828B3|nr:VirB4 family type IV secretion/conjugal transfer ATPase [Massilia sp. erpn]UTY59673.1 VirB4 family type IV secretion/conjugal transfer ATPase [Massilia sp. erpn]
MKDGFAPTLELAVKEDLISKHLPFSARVTENVVSTRGGDYMSTWSVTGLPFEGLSCAEAYAKMEALNLLVRSLSNGKYAFWVHRIRRTACDALSVPAGGFPHRFLQKYYDRLGAGGMMSTEIFLTVIYRPQPQRTTGLLGKIGRTLEDIAREQAEALDVMESLHQQVCRTLDAYGPQRLGEYEHHSLRYSRQQEFYAYLLNGHWWRIPVKDVPLYKYLPMARVLFGNEIVETRSNLGSTYSTFIDIKDYADFSHPGILNTMLSLPYEYVETHSFSPMNVLDAKAALTLQRNRMISASDNSVSQLAQLNDALDGVASGNFTLGEYHYSLQVKSASVDGIKAARSAAIEALQSAGFLAVAVDLVTDHAYFAQLPANWRSRPRSAHLSSRNFTGLCAMHNFTLGKRDANPWGEAVTILRSPAAQPFYFNFHATAPGEDSLGASALGNCQIIGQSGGGKTVLALFLMMNLYKYGTQMVFFDKDRGAEIAVRAAGGQYLSLERGKPTGFNPFKMEVNEANILFWDDLVKFCTLIPGAPHSPREEAEISHAVRAVALLPASLRGFSAVMQNLPNVDANSVAERLRKWCADGQLGWALDCNEDLLQFDATRSYGFDYTELLEDAQTCPAIMMYLMYRVESLIDGRRFAFFMDEYWKALSVSYFEDFAKNKQKTIRKQNGFGVYMTQSPSDTLRSPIARALIEQTATFIFLPNPTADYGDYVDGFKLTETEFELLKSLGEGSRMFLIKQGTSTAIAMLDLHGFSDELKILSGTTANVARLDALRARHGDHPDQWITHFLEEVR